MAAKISKNMILNYVGETVDKAFRVFSDLEGRLLAVHKMDISRNSVNVFHHVDGGYYIRNSAKNPSKQHL
jgi:hypothetical protein